MLIDCESCSGRGSACAGCVVTVLLGPPGQETPADAGTGGLDLDAADRRALHVLAGAGLVPPLRHQVAGTPRAG